MLTSGIGKEHAAFLEACEFLKLDPDGEAADKLARGLGYAVDYRVLKACDYGAPTIRKRFYLVARRDGLPIVFPEPTHGKGKEPYRTAAECIDWSVPCPSIFGRKKPLAANTLRRIARGLDKFVIRNQRPYIVSNNTNNVPHGIGEPLPTQTTGNRNYLCTPSLLQYHSEQGKGEVRGQGVNNPLMTVDGSNRYAINAAYLSKFFSGERRRRKSRRAGADGHGDRSNCAGYGKYSQILQWGGTGLRDRRSAAYGHHERPARVGGKPFVRVAQKHGLQGSSGAHADADHFPRAYGAGQNVHAEDRHGAGPRALG